MRFRIYILAQLGQCIEALTIRGKARTLQAITVIVYRAIAHLYNIGINYLGVLLEQVPPRVGRGAAPRERNVD